MPWGLGHGGPLKYLFDKPAGAIKRLLELPCATPPSIYIEAAGTALIDAFIDYASPDPRELYTRAFGQSIFCHVEGTAGKVLHLPTAPRSKYQRFLLPLLRTLDISTYWYFLASIAAGGVIEWSTLARKMTYCDATTKIGAGTGTYYLSAIPDDGRFTGTPYAFDGNPYWGPVSYSDIVMGPHSFAILACSGQWQSATGITVPTTSRLIQRVLIPPSKGPQLPDFVQFDQDVNEVDQYGQGRPTHVWHKGKNPTDGVIEYRAQWSYIGGVPLPYHEAFPVAGAMNCFKYAPQ